MSIWNRVLAAIGVRKTTGEVEIEGDRVVLRDLRRAKAFPQEPESPGRKEMAACERCGKRLRQVVFTTAGSGDQIEVWRQYPLAVDGWLCVACGWSVMPRFISPEESVEYGRTGAEHAKSGQLDDAEFWFRRILGSWPGYPAGYADLGQISTARAETASAPEERARYRSEAEGWFRRAVQADAEHGIAGVRVALARALALNDKEQEAIEVLDELLGAPAVSEPERAEAERVLADLRAGKALFSRATELAGDHVLEPPAKPLSATARRSLERARALARQAAERETSFATSWFLGKLELRLGNMDAALTALQQAHALNPDQPDGCRELASVYLELDRAQDALPLARRAAELRPGDAGLDCNLAIILLLTGDVDGARAQAAAALSRDPGDAITGGVLNLIDDVRAGRRPRPRSLAEAEGRKR